LTKVYVQRELNWTRKPLSCGRSIYWYSIWQGL